MNAKALMDAADRLAAEARIVRDDETGDHVSVTIHIEDWRTFWASVDAERDE